MRATHVVTVGCFLLIAAISSAKDITVGTAGTVVVKLGAIPTDNDRPTCAEKYPNHDPNWHCHESGVSACGGPDQCSCDDDERLVSYVCDEGFQAQCEVDEYCQKTPPKVKVID